MKSFTTTRYLLSTATLLAIVGTAVAVSVPEVTNCENITTVYKGDGSAGQFYSGTGPEMLYDGDFVSGVVQNDRGSYFIVNFTTWDPEGYYVSDITVGHLGNVPYTVQYTLDGTTWIPVVGAENVTTSGQTVYQVKNVVKKLKYIFDEVEERDESLTEFQVKGYEYVPLVFKVSSLNRSIFFRDNHGTRGRAGLNGGHYSNMVFDGNFSNYTYQNAAGAEFVIPTTDESTGDAYYVTDFIVGHAGNFKYSLYYTTEPEPADILDYAHDPRNWLPIAGAQQIQAAGKKTYGVNALATAVKYVYDTMVSWTTSLGELEVWAMDPAHVPCSHTNIDAVAWTPVPGSATCLDYGVDERVCPDCGEVFTRENKSFPPLGHDYEDNLVEPGRVKVIGSGSISCSRCDWSLDCTVPVDLITNKVNGAKIGGILTEGVVYFTDLTVSSTGNPDWGVSSDDMIDNNWTWSWGSYWYSETTARDHDPHIDFSFGTVIDLVYVDISVENKTHFVTFFSVDDETGLETQLTQFEFIRTDNNEEEDPVLNPHNKETFDMLPVEEDDGIDRDYQRFKVHFREAPTRHLRIRMLNWDAATPKQLYIAEVHPWGTVRGAGDIFAEKTTLIMLK